MMEFHNISENKTSETSDLDSSEENTISPKQRLENISTENDVDILSEGILFKRIIWLPVILH